MTNRPFNSSWIQWYEGMLLAPQHFQQADLLQRNLWHYHLSKIAPFYWGMRNISISPQQLIDGVVNVISFEAVFPDGSVVFFPDGPNDKLILDLTQIQAPKNGAPVKIYLVAPLTSTPSNTHDTWSKSFESIESEPIKDMNTGDCAITISRLKPKLSLTTELLPSHTVSMPILEVVRVGDKFSQTEYIPPLLTFRPQNVLLQRCQKIAQQIREKLLYLQEKLQNPFHGQLADDLNTSQDLAKARQHLIAGLLPFEVSLHETTLSPRVLHMALCTLAGHILAIQKQTYPAPLPPYTHHDINSSFDGLFDIIESTLSSVEEAYASIVLDQQDRVFSLKLPLEYIERSGYELILAAQPQAGISENDLVQWIQDAVIATDNFIDRAQETRILGARRQVAPPSLVGVPQLSHGTVVFSVTCTPPFILPDDFLRIFNISDTPENRPQSLIFYLPNT